MSVWQGPVNVGWLVCLLWTCASGEVRDEPRSGEGTVADAPYINTWLVAGTFDNDRKNAGYDRDWIGEAAAAPKEGRISAGRTWRYFDDRLFSRNYDDYQDLFSYFKIKRGESVAAKVAYAHVYIHSPRPQAGQLRLGADNEFKAWVNGVQVAASTKGHPHRDAVKIDVSLRAGWNRILLKIANQQNGRFGFYARLSDKQGQRLAGLTYSVNGAGDALAVSTGPMGDANTSSMPTAYREWPYVGADAIRHLGPNHDIAPYLLKQPRLAMKASDFALMAAGGQPPYRWSLADGQLPSGLSLRRDGSITGTITAAAKLGVHRFRVRATDGVGKVADKTLEMTVQERPNLWYEQARLTALIHHPEAMPEAQFTEFAALMKRQGYGVGMIISYNNGRHRYRWPSIYQPACPVGDLVGKYKSALESAGVKFGMYVGNLNGANHGGANGSILLVEDAMRRYRPTAFWFDWAGWHGESLDAIYSMIRSYSPQTVIVLNGVPTICNGDWDVIVLEGWGAWGRRHWDLWPFHIDWPKRHAVETWRLVADPEFEASPGVWSDWRDYLRLQISLIGEGFIANIDHSPTIRMGEAPVGQVGTRAWPGGRLACLDNSHVWQCHRQMTVWANPLGRPALTESYTNVNPGPLPEAQWGYSTINLSRDAVYLHMLVNPRGKTGLPSSDRLAIGPIRQKVKRVCWMNRNIELPFTQDEHRLTIQLEGVIADTIDTIFKIVLAGPHPLVDTKGLGRPQKPIPSDNLATHRPSRLLSTDGQRTLMASAFHFARYGVDGDPTSVAQGAHEWAWTYHVDLEDTHAVRRVVINFGNVYATEYKLHLSPDGTTWKTVAHVTGCSGGKREHAFDPLETQFIRVQAVKPNGPNQPGAQMSIAELEVYE